jgi:hypothetical protein
MQETDVEQTCPYIIKRAAYFQRRDALDSSVVTKVRAGEDYNPVEDQTGMADGAGFDQ